MKMDIEQAQLGGNFDFTDSSRLDFGVALTEMKNRTAFSTVQNDTWGSDVAFDPAAFPDDVWRADTIRQYFDQISGSGNSNLFNNFFTFDFDTGAQHRCRPAWRGPLQRSPGPSRPIVTSRKNRRAPMCSSASRSTLRCRSMRRSACATSRQT